MSIPSPDELRRTKQPIPTDRLVRWAEEAGFETKRPSSGTSHIVCRHKEFRDIKFNIIADSRLLSSQRNLSDALREIDQRGTEKSKIASTFDQSATERIEEAYARLPSYLKAEHDFQNGYTVIRDRHLPQLGMTVPFAEARLLENKIRYLEDNKRDVYVLMNRYDIGIAAPSKRSRERVLFHPVYDIPAVMLEPYKPGASATSFFDKLHGFVNSVFERDLENEQRLSKIFAHGFIGNVHTNSTARRGERNNVLSCVTPRSGSITIKFTSHSEQRLRRSEGLIDGRISEPTLRDLERRVQGLARAHQKFDLQAA